MGGRAICPRLGALAPAGALALAGAIAGCGVGAPASPPAPHVPAPVAQAERTHEYPGPPAPIQHASGTAASPEMAVRAFAQRYINWGADTVTGILRRLARASVGQARSAMELEAAQVASDPALAQGGIANAGTVEAVAPAAGGGGRYVVVTRERTTATSSTAYQGLRPAWHVTVATVRQLAPGAWVVSGWQPES